MSAADVKDQGPPPERQIPEAAVELRADIKEDLFGIDESTLDPDMHYRMCNENQQIQARRRAKGYRPVSRSQDGVRMITDFQSGDAEDLIRVGDCILMCCPKEAYERREAERRRITRGRLSVPEASFRKKAKEAPVEVEVITKKDMKERGRR